MKLSKPKYIFVTGGVASSLGKGIISASIARLLQARGYSVTIQKLDPYINVDPGTLNPYEHGECYVTEDGAETDLDLGHYERFTNQPTSKANNVTTGKIYKSVIEKERKGEYLGKTVQVIPHITDEIKRRIQMLAQKKVYDVIITEIGGTVGDIESLPFIESVRQLRYSLGYKSTALVHLTLIPYMAASGQAEDQAHAAFGQGPARKRVAARHPRAAHGASAVDQPAPQGGVVLQCRRQRRDGVDRRPDDLRSAAEDARTAPR